MMIFSMWVLFEIAVFLFLLWISWRYFDHRYKQNRNRPPSGMYDASLEKTSEVFIDPKDGLKYRVYYNRRTGEREYVRED